MPDPSSWIVWVRVYTWKWPFVQLGDLDRLGDCYLNEYGGTNLGIKSDSDPKTSVGYLSPGAVRVNLAEGYWGMEHLSLGLNMQRP